LFKLKQVQPKESAMSALAPEILVLEKGDRWTRKEFERRYHAMPRLKKAELIEGVVFMPSPLHFEQHAKPHALVMGWLAAYWAASPGIELADNATLRLDADNEFQPDALLRLPERAGGASRVSRDDYLRRASRDTHDKRKVYRRNGVREYLVWLVRERRLLWLVLEDDEYQPLQPGADGLLRSRTFPGLALNGQALLDGDLARVLADQQRCCQGGEEHRRFVEALRQTAGE